MISDRHSNPLTSLSQQHGFICMSTTVDELSYTPSQEEKTRDAEQVVATGRKSWKTLRGRGEAVWPPFLEAALLEALAKYQKEAISIKAQKSGRFPMRNRYISEYIQAATGKYRSAKQVGSRIQQLRDTCKRDKILQLILRRGASEWQAMGMHPDCDGRASVTPPPEQAFSSTPTFIHVQISLQKELRPCPVPTVHFIANDQMNPYIIKLSPRLHLDPKIKTSACSDLSYLSGMVEFFSPCPLVSQSTFLVYWDDSRIPQHSEIAPIKCLSSPTKRHGWLYSSQITPDFWNTLCSSPDLTRYTIIQSLRPISNLVSELDRTNPTIFIAYKFNYQEPIQTSFHTVEPVTYPTPPANQSVLMDSDSTQWPVPSRNMKSQLPLPNANEQMSLNVAALSVQELRHDYPVVDRYQQLNYYYPASSLTSGPWSNEQDSSPEYWQHRH